MIQGFTGMSPTNSGVRANSPIRRQFHQLTVSVALLTGLSLNLATAAPVTVDFTLDMQWTKFGVSGNNQYAINGFLASAGLPGGTLGPTLMGSEPRSTVTGSLVYDPDTTYTITNNTGIAKQYKGAITDVDFKIGTVSFSIDKPAANNTGSLLNTYESGILGMGVNRPYDELNFATYSVTPELPSASNRYNGNTADFSYSITRGTRVLNYAYRIGVSDFMLDLGLPGLLDEGIGIAELEDNLAALGAAPLPTDGIDSINQAKIIFHPFDVSRATPSLDSGLVRSEAFRLDGQITSLSLRDSNTSTTPDPEPPTPGNTVPEPASVALIATGLLGMGLTRRRLVGQTRHISDNLRVIA